MNGIGITPKSSISWDCFSYWNSLPHSFWGRNRLACWLLHSKFASKYAVLFHENKLEYSDFIQLKDVTLRSMGVDSPLARLKLMRTIKQIKHIKPTSAKLGRKNSAPMWTKENVLDWLDTLDFGWEIIKRFEDLEIDGSKLVRLNNKSLEKLLAIKSRVLRLRYIFAINSLSKSGNWKHLSNLDYDFESSRPNSSLGFFSPSFVVSANFRPDGKENGFNSKDFVKTFFPFNSKQINLAMFTYKGAYSRKRKRNAMETKDVSTWLKKLNFSQDVISAFVENRIDGAELFEMTKEDLKQRLKIKTEETCVSLMCDINYLKSRMANLFDLPNLIDLYNRTYRKFLREEISLAYKCKAQKIETIKNDFTPLESSKNACTLREGFVEIDLGLLNPPSNRSREESVAETRKADRKTEKSFLFKKDEMIAWARNHQIGKEYLFFIEKMPENELYELFEDSSGFLGSTEICLSRAEKAELDLAIEDFRLIKFKMRNKRNSPLKLSKPFEKLKKINISESLKPKPIDSSSGLPFYNANEFGKKSPPTSTPRSHAPPRPDQLSRLRQPHPAKSFQKNFPFQKYLQRRVAQSEAFKRTPETQRGQLRVLPISRKKLAAFSSAGKIPALKMPPPPPPNEQRPPFDVGLWNSAHVLAYLKNITPLRPHLSKLSHLNGRRLLDIAKFSKSVEGLDAQSVQVLRDVSHSLNFRDLANVPVEDWTPSHVQAWLEIDTDLPKYGAYFRQKNITGKILVQLTHEMLLGDLAINLAEREKILISVQKLIARAKPVPTRNTRQTAGKEHNLAPLSLWEEREVCSWVESFRFGALYKENFSRLATKGTDLVKATTKTLRDRYLIPISLHRDAMVASLENYKSEADLSHNFENPLESIPATFSGGSENAFFSRQTNFPPFIPRGGGESSLERRMRKPAINSLAESLLKEKDRRVAEQSLLGVGNGKLGERTGEAAFLFGPKKTGRNDAFGKRKKDEILIECSFCRKRFENTDALISHLAIHEKSCSICTESFASNEMLDEHISTKHFDRNLGSSQADSELEGESKLLTELFGGKSPFESEHKSLPGEEDDSSDLYLD